MARHAALVGAFAWLCALCGHSLAAEKPNVVVIIADDLGHADVGFQGSKDIPTPNLDSLAASGIRFTSGYSSHPFCSPMRAALMTSRYQHRFGYERNVAYDPQNPRLGLPPSEKTVPERLNAAGYVTGAVGKWHLGAASVCHPNKRGFDFFYGFLGGGHDYFDVDSRRPMGEGYQTPLDRNGKPEAFEGYLTHALSREAVGFIEANRGKPFYLYLAYNAPHTPLQAPKEYLEKLDHIANPRRRTYAAMVNAMDDGVGDVLETLDRLSLRERTLVFFLSDNGGPPPATSPSDNGPLRGYKGDVFEGGIRVPFVASWPGVLPKGMTFDAPVISLDIPRTALALAGADPGPSSNLDGVNLLPFLTGEQSGSPHGALFWRKENGKSWAVRAGDEKLARVNETRPLMFFDLAADIGETKDLAPERRARIDVLQQQFRAWNRLNQPPRFLDFRSYHERKGEFYQSIDSSIETESATKEP